MGSNRIWILTVEFIIDGETYETSIAPFSYPELFEDEKIIQQLLEQGYQDQEHFDCFCLCSHPLDNVKVDLYSQFKRYDREGKLIPERSNY